MDIAEIKRQIAGLPTPKHGLLVYQAPNEELDECVRPEDLQALIASHNELLEAAKAVKQIFRLQLNAQLPSEKTAYAQLQAAIARASE